MPHPRERPGAFTRNRGVTRRGDGIDVSRACARRRSRVSRRLVGGGRRNYAGAGEAWSEGRWRARRREAGVTRPGARGRERARRSKIDRRVARRSGGETDPIARVSARVALAALARISPPPKIAARSRLFSHASFALPSASRHRRVVFGAPSRGVMSAGTRYADRTMRAAPLAAPAGRDRRRHDRPEARAIEARQKRRPRSFKLTRRRPTSRTTG